MDRETYARLPALLAVRALQVTVTRPGSRTRQLVVATTLLSVRDHPKEDIEELYHRRWHVELDLRSLKQTIKMDRLSRKTPEMARKELWAHLLASNLVRAVMAQGRGRPG